MFLRVNYISHAEWSNISRVCHNTHFSLLELIASNIRVYFPSLKEGVTSEYIGPWWMQGNCRRVNSISLCNRRFSLKIESHRRSCECSRSIRFKTLESETMKSDRASHRNMDYHWCFMSRAYVTNLRWGKIGKVTHGLGRQEHKGDGDGVSDSPSSFGELWASSVHLLLKIRIFSTDGPRGK